MDVGQVQFSVEGKGLDATLQSAKELEAVLNGIDGSKIGAKSSGLAKAGKQAVKTAQKDENQILNIKNKARKLAAGIEYKYALQNHNKIKRLNEKHEKRQQDWLREQAKLEKDIAVRQHNEDVKMTNDHEKRQQQMRMEDAKLEAQLATRQHAEKIKAEQAEQKLKEQGAKQLSDRWDKEMDDYTNKVLKETENRYALEKQAYDDLVNYQRERDAERLRKRQEYYSNVEQGLVNAGARMQTLGVAMQRISAPFTNVMRGLTMGIGYRMLGTITDSITGAFSRYDTMHTYSEALKQIGLNAEKKFVVGTGKAKTAVENLNDAVLGLPTGLDEIVASMKVYAGMTNDVEKATKIAIAANNAFIAGGENETRTRMAERQIQNLISNGELTAQQWNSLQKNMAVGFNAVGQELGYTKDNMASFLADMKKGKFTAEEFIDAFIKVGTEGSLYNAANVMKQTWNAVSQNMQNAVARAGEGILKTLDSVFVKMDGRNFLQHVLGVDKNGEYIGGGIRGVIDDIGSSVQGWIKANPEKITNFFNNISKINWTSIASGFGKFAMNMGRFYAFMGRFLGNGSVVRFMLRMNLVGKAVQLAGGFTKGGASLFAWIATLAKFGGAGKAAEKLGNLAKALGGASQVGEAASTMAISWQGVASKAVTIAAIPAIAWSLKEVAVALQEFNKVDLNWGLVPKIAAAGGAITAFAGLAAGLGALTTGNALGWITTAGTAVGIAEVASIAKTMKWVGEGLSAIADAKIPDAHRLTRVMTTMNTVSKYFKSRNPLEAIGKIFDSWTKGSEFKAIKNMTDAFDGISRMLNVKLKKGWKKNAKDRLGQMFQFAAELESFMVDQDKWLQGKSSNTQGLAKGQSHAKSVENSFTVRKERMREFADVAGSMAGGISQMFTALKSVNRLNSLYSKMKDNKDVNFDWGVIRKRISRIAGAFYKLAVGEGEEKAPLQKLHDAAQKVEGADYTKITEALGELPKIINKIDAIQKKLSESSMFSTNTATARTNALDLETRIKPIFDILNVIQESIPDDVSGFKGMKTINRAMDGIKSAISKLRNLSNIDTSGIDQSKIQGLASKLETAFASLEKVANKEINIAFKVGEIKGADEVLSSVTKEIESLKGKIEELNGNIDKTINVYLKSGGVFGGFGIVDAVRRRIADIRARVAGLDGSISKSISVSTSGGGAWHTGGKIRPLYRAHGGEIFQTRGTDTVPAMLTRGEWVINRRATSRIGDEALWRLNHLDIAGAVRSLSARMASGTRNVTNNSRTANVTVNNYNSASAGLSRGSSWVRRLNG